MKNPTPCSVDGCDGPVKARGLCGAHYQRWLIYGDPTYTKRRAKGQLCAIDGCQRLAESREWCAMHYQRWYSHGDVGEAAPRLYLDPVDAFWAKVNQQGPVPPHRPELGPCWVWTAAVNWQGYGRMKTKARRIQAHRFAYELLVGPMPEGLEPDHLCKNPPCVNPWHLEPVTHRENMLRSDSVSGLNARKTHCPRGHEYTEANTSLRSDGARHCRECGRISDRARAGVDRHLNRNRRRKAG